MASRNFWRTALRFIVTKQKHIIRNGPNDFGIHRKNCTSTLSEKGCFMSSSFKKLSKLHQGCLKTKCVWVPLMPKIQCWIPSHVPGLLLMSWEILALESSMIGNSQIYTQFSSFWPRDSLFNSASAVRTTAGLREKQERAHMYLQCKLQIYNMCMSSSSVFPHQQTWRKLSQAN